MGISLNVRGLFCPEAIKEQQTDLKGLLQLQFEVSAYLDREKEKSEREIERDSEHDLPPTLMQPVSFHFSPLCIALIWFMVCVLAEIRRVIQP